MPNFSYDLNAVAYGKGVFVTVGTKGIIRVSPDGERWSDVKSGTSNALYDIVWTGKMFIAVGEKGTIITSTNGLQWKSTVSHTISPLYAVATNGQHHVVVGDYDTILYSTSNNMWQQAKPFSSILAEDVKRLKVQSQGANLFDQSLPVSFFTFTDVTYGDKGFIVIANEEHVAGISKDGVTWKPIYLGRSKIERIVSSGQKTIAVEKVKLENREESYYDKDYIPDPWERLESTYENILEIHLGLSNIFLTGKTFWGVCYNETSSTEADSFQLVRLSSEKGNPKWSKVTTYYGKLTGLTWNGKCYVGVGEAGLILTSVDGKEWVLRSITPLRGGIRFIRRDGDRFLVVSDKGRTASTRDWIHWTHEKDYRDSSGNEGPSGETIGNITIIPQLRAPYFSGAAPIPEQILYRSVDGKEPKVFDWKQGRDIYLYQLWAEEKYFIGVGLLNAGTTKQFIPQKAGIFFFHPDFSLEKFVPLQGCESVERNGQLYYADCRLSGINQVSKDLLHWNKLTSSTQNADLYFGTDIRKISQYFFAQNAKNELFVSSDGYHWTKTTVHVDQKVTPIWNGKIFLIYGKQILYLSKDGYNWRISDTIPNFNINTVFWDGKQFVGYGAEIVTFTIAEW